MTTVIGTGISRMTVSEQERTLVSQARTIERLEEKLRVIHLKAADLQAQIEAERTRLRSMVDRPPPPDGQS